MRGLAALAVFIFHLTHGSPIAPRGVVTSITAYGWLGVEVFFVISGFIIPYALFRASYHPSRYGRFVLRRILRLDPPYLASILLILGVAYLLTWAPNYAGPPFRFDPATVFAHLLYLNAILGFEWLSPVYWTLAIEFYYYLVVGLVYPLVVSAARWKRLVLLLVLISLSLVPATAAVGFRYVPLFAMGFVVLQRRLQLIGARETLVLTAAVAAACVLSLGVPHALAGVAAAGAITSLDLRTRVTAFLGTISYSLYLVHPPVVRAVLTVGRGAADTDARRPSCSWSRSR